MNPHREKIDNLVIIDSNFILIPFQFKINYFNEIRENLEGKLKFVIFKQILDELKAKSRRESKSGKFQLQLNSGLNFIERNKEHFDIEIIKVIKDHSETTDDFLIRNLISLKIEAKHVFLATNDQELRKRAKKARINVIFLRQKKYLFFDWS